MSTRSFSQLGERPGLVRGVGLLRHDALEAHAADRVVEGLALRLDVIGVAHRSGLRQQLLQDALALHEWQRPQVEVFEGEQVEDEERRRQVDGGARDVGGALQERAALQPLKARPRLVVEHHHLAVEDDAVVRQAAQRTRDLGEGRGRIGAAPEDELALVPVAAGEDAVAVVLQLEDPVLARERRVAGFREHQPGLRERQLAARRLQLLELGANFLGVAVAVLQLFERQPRVDRLLGRDRRAARARPGIALLDQHPLFRGVAAALALEAEQVPGAAQLVAAQLEVELAAAHPLLRILERHPQAAVPDDHGTGAVVAFGDHALEVGVLDRMVLDFHRQALLVDVVRRPLRHGPRQQHAAEFEAEVVVQAPRRVLLDAKEMSGSRRSGYRCRRLLDIAAERFGRAVGRALVAILLQRLRGRLRLHASNLSAGGHGSCTRATPATAASCGAPGDERHR